MQDHYCVNFRSNDERSKSGENLSFFNFSSNDLLRSKWIVATRHDEGPDFEIRKSRVVTSALLAERIIGDRLCLSISDSANSFFLFFVFMTMNWRPSSSASWSANFFFSYNLFCQRSLPSLVHANCDEECKPSYNLKHILWLEVSRAHQINAFLYLADSFKTANFHTKKRGRISIHTSELIKTSKT